MTSSKPPRTRTGAADDPGPQTLLALPPGERRDAEAKDVHRRAPQFSAIPAHDLADALDVPEHWRPGSEWSFPRYAPIVSVEGHARYNSPASELVYLIEEAVVAERFQQLLMHSEPVDESDDPSFAFLTKGERDLPPLNRTSHFSKKSITLENDGHENQQIQVKRQLKVDEKAIETYHEIYQWYKAGS